MTALNGIQSPGSLTPTRSPLLLAPLRVHNELLAELAAMRPRYYTAETHRP
jgi:hypothetical protein